jgi:peptide/nickel transport system ATP-binding protein/oligopeptide transport system ATP-binding protein
MDNIVLSIEGLKTYFRVKEGLLKAVDGISYQLKSGKTLGLVGESGSGKTVSALSILRLLESPPAKIHGGKILFNGQDLVCLSEKKMQAIRGNDISMIFQEPMTSLNPVLTVGYQIGESLYTHKSLTSRQITKRTIELLEMVGIPSPDKRIAEYPHQMSGGMRQRIMIALALAGNPKLLIADEPTTALDVTIQAQIMELLKDIQTKLGTSILLITHDLAVIAESAHQIAVMYAGKIVEFADVRTIFHSAAHPYTQGLLLSIPRIDQTKQVRRLKEIPGQVPNMWSLPKGCSFQERCPISTKQCQENSPKLRPIEDGHSVRCWNVKNV